MVRWLQRYTVKMQQHLQPMPTLAQSWKSHTDIRQDNVHGQRYEPGISWTWQDATHSTEIHYINITQWHHSAFKKLASYLILQVFVSSLLLQKAVCHLFVFGLQCFYLHLKTLRYWDIHIHCLQAYKTFQNSFRSRALIHEPRQCIWN